MMKALAGSLAREISVAREHVARYLLAELHVKRKFIATN